MQMIINNLVVMWEEKMFFYISPQNEGYRLRGGRMGGWDQRVDKDNTRNNENKGD